MLYVLQEIIDSTAMPCEDTHYALPFNAMQSGHELYGSRYFDLSYPEFLKDYDRQRIFSTRSSFLMMTRFGNAAGVLQQEMTKSDSDLCYIEWVSHVSSGSKFYSDIVHDRAKGGSDFAAYSSESVAREFELLYRVRVVDVALAFAGYEASQPYYNEQELDEARRRYQENIEYHKKNMQTGSEQSIRVLNRHLDWHLRSVRAWRSYQYDINFRRFYTELSEVIDLWGKACEYKYGILIAHG